MTIKPNASHQSLSETTVIIHASTEPTEMSLVTMGSIFFFILHQLVSFKKYTTALKLYFRELRTIPTLRGVKSPTLARGILCPT